MDPKTLVDFSTPHSPRAYVNSTVRFHHNFTLEQRIQAAEKAGWNVFQFPSEMLKGGDLLSDSGTTTLTAEQMAAMILGDEAYGSNYGYFKLLEAFQDTFGFPQEQSEVYLFHQGRAAEHALFSEIGKLGKDLKIPSNGHFDTTFANIQANAIQPINCFSPKLKTAEYDDFKGNMDLEKLQSLLERDGERIPLVYITITNNTGGGQPVSLENIHAVKALCDEHNKPLFLDACRFAENAWFIKKREEKYQNAEIIDIVRECFSLCDGFTISLKKDGLANIGGALLIRRGSQLCQENPQLLNSLRDHQILTEGHPTYGGMPGRDLMTLCEGLKIVVQQAYLDNRINQVQDFGTYLKELDIPVLSPFGGHAVYINTDEFFQDTELQRSDYGGISLTALLLLKGIRLCELGVFAFGDDHPHNFVRCAIPRNKYEIQDLYYVADCIKALHEKRQHMPKAVCTYGKDLTLRHFKARFKLENSSLPKS